MKSVWTPDSESSARSSVAVLPRSVSTSRQPARESVLAMRSAGKCGSMGRYAPPALKLDMQFLAGEQALPLVLGIWIGGDQRERGEVIAGDPGDTVRVEHVRPVPQPHEPVMLQEADPQHGVLSELPAVLGRHIEHGLEQWLGQAQLTPQIVDRNVRVRQQCELG